MIISLALLFFTQFSHQEAGRGGQEDQEAREEKGEANWQKIEVFVQDPLLVDVFN